MSKKKKKIIEKVEHMEYSLILSSATWVGTSVSNGKGYLRQGSKCIQIDDGYYHVTNFEDGLLARDIDTGLTFETRKVIGEPIDEFIIQVTSSRDVNEERFGRIVVREVGKDYDDADKIIEIVGELPCEFHWEQWPLNLMGVVKHDDPFEAYYIRSRFVPETDEKR